MRVREWALQAAGVAGHDLQPSRERMLEFWSATDIVHEFPDLSKVGTLFSTIKCTSVKPERQNSNAGLIASKKRNRTGNHLFDILCFITDNEHLLPQDIANIPKVKTHVVQQILKSGMASVSSTSTALELQKAAERQQQHGLNGKDVDRPSPSQQQDINISAEHAEIEARLRQLAAIDDELVFEFVQSSLQDEDTSADSLTEALESLAL